MYVKNRQGLQYVEYRGWVGIHQAMLDAELCSALDLPAALAANQNGSLEHCMSFWDILWTLKLISCVIYLASENYAISYAYFTRWKNNASACLEAGAWGSRSSPLDKTALGLMVLLNAVATT